MQVEFTQTVIAQGGVFKAGTSADLPDDLAQELVRVGHCKVCDSKKRNATVKQRGRKAVDE